MGELDYNAYNAQAKPFVPRTASDGPAPANPPTAAKNQRHGRSGRGVASGTAAPNHRNRQTRAKPAGGSGKRRGSLEDDLDDLIFSGNSLPRNKRGQVSISHLLELGPQYRPQAAQQTGGTHKRPYASGASYRDKAMYINMTCRFVLDPRSDYRHLLADPDSFVSMDSVQRIIAQPSTCPICLEDRPEAPRMLECGHILCYPCLFRYMASEDVVRNVDERTKHKDCPLCLDKIRLDKVKPVTLSSSLSDERYDTPHVDQDCVLRLMFRPMDSLSVVPKDSTSDGELRRNDFDDLASVDGPSQYCRLCRGSVDYVLREFGREIEELTAARLRNSELYGEESSIWYSDAISAIQDTCSVYAAGTPTAVVPSRGSELPDIGTLSLENSAPRASRPGRLNDISQDYSDDTAYFFYQTGLESLTKFFLAPLDIRILKRAFGSYSAFPPVVLAKVDNVVYGSSVDDELRKRTKYLGHLPTQTPVAFLECDWRDIVPDDILSQYAKELQQRRQRKKVKDRREEQSRQRIEKQKQEQFRRELVAESNYPPSFFNLPESESAIVFDESDPILPSKDASDIASSPELASGVWGQGPSFAQAAANGAPSADNERAINELLSQAQPSRKGRKKLVLMSNQRRYS